MNVAIIPARGGSKRLPRKNIKPFFGRPVIYYSIRAAVDSGLFEHIIVSTDDDEIAVAVAASWLRDHPLSASGTLPTERVGEDEGG